MHDDLGFLLNAAARSVRSHFSESLREIGLTVQQGAALLAIGGAPRELWTHRAISQSVGTDPATTSGLLHRLERDGWLQSTAHPSDARSRIFSLTDSGTKALPRIRSAAQAASAQVEARLGERQAARLKSLLQLLIEADGGPR